MPPDPRDGNNGAACGWFPDVEVARRANGSRLLQEPEAAPSCLMFEGAHRAPQKDQVAEGRNRDDE